MQFETKSFCPSAIVFAFAGTGFGRFVAVGGAFQSELCAKTRVVAKTNESPRPLVIRPLQIDERVARLELDCHTNESVVRSSVHRLRIFTEKIQRSPRDQIAGRAIGLTRKIDVLNVAS
jgi:hypothetical protein